MLAFLRRLAALLKRLASLEPVLLIAVITAIVMTFGIWGVNVADLGDRLGQSINILWPLFTLIGAAWARSKVTRSSAVVQVVTPDGIVVAGPASPLPDGTPIVAEVARHLAD